MLGSTGVSVRGQQRREAEDDHEPGCVHGCPSTLSEHSPGQTDAVGTCSCTGRGQDVPRAAGSALVSQLVPFGADAQGRATCLALAPALDVAAVGKCW